MKFTNREEVEFLTSNWTGERLPDGRPKVSADLLSRLRHLTLEEAWGTIYQKGYKYQFEGDFLRTNPDPEYRLVGRATTATLMPTRPDLQEILMKQGQEVEGKKGTFNQWVIDSLVDDDVVVVDFFGKVRDGTFIGGNLATAIRSRTGQGGAVFWGGVRDLEQIVKIDGLQVFYKGEDPTAIAEYVMTGLNTACRIGGAVCLPGDIVFGTQSGVLFIPAHLVEEVVIKAEKAHVRDIFGFLRLQTGIYTTSQIDTGWTPAIYEDFFQWIKTSEEGTPYRQLTWDEEWEQALEKERQGDQPPSVTI